MKIKKLTAFVLSDVIIGLVLVSALATAAFLMLQDNDSLDMYAASCADESELYGHAIACGNVLYNNTGVLPNCDEIGDCVVNQAALTTKWPNLAKTDIASPTAVNLTFGDSGIDGVADDEVECSGSPVTLTLNCTDDRVGGAAAAAPTCTPLGATDTTCDGVDDNCSGTADDGYVSSGSCQVAGTNATCPAEEVTGSYICQSGSEVCDAGVQVATCPAVCGNGTQEAGEACDDGNLVPGDGCDENCLVESVTTAVPGNYTLVMFDRFGDGWQGGPDPGFTFLVDTGINVVLSNGFTLQTGLCNTYSGQTTNCEASSFASIPINVPTAITSWQWTFLGDEYSEACIKVVCPDGVTNIFECGGPSCTGINFTGTGPLCPSTSQVLNIPIDACN